MMVFEDPFVALDDADVDFPASCDEASPARTSRNVPPDAAPPLYPSVVRLHGFDLDDRPLMIGIPGCLGEIVSGRTTVALTQAMIGRDVLVLFEGGRMRSPIVVGVLQSHPVASTTATAGAVGVKVDDECRVIEAERQIVLRCGDASITLTRAGKVLIEGTYVISRSSGYNKLKGAAVDIN